MNLPHIFKTMAQFARRVDIFSIRFAKFCAVGGMNASLDFFCYLFCLWLGVSSYTARTFSWIIATVFSYAINKSWTFNACDKGLLPLLRFGIVNVCALGFGLLLLFIFKKIGSGNEVAFILSLPFTTAMNYLGYRFWAFRHVDS